MEHRPSDGNNLTPHGGTASAAGGGKKSATRKSDQTRCHTTGQYGKSRNVTAPSHCGFFCNRNNTRGGLLCHDRNKQVHTGPYKLCPPPVKRTQKAAGKRAFSEGVKKSPSTAVRIMQYKPCVRMKNVTPNHPHHTPLQRSIRHQTAMELQFFNPQTPYNQLKSLILRTNAHAASITSAF